MTSDGDEENAQHRGHLLAVLVDLQRTAQRLIELTAALPHQVLNLESLASDTIAAAWRIRARVLEAFAAIVVLEEELPLAAIDIDGGAARWPPAPADIIWRAGDGTTHPPSEPPPL